MRDCILITGGAGFIGSALSKLVCASALPVVAVDSFLEQVHPSGQRSEFLDDRVILLKRDVRDANTWADLLGEYRPVKVLHLAAETGTAQSLTEATRHASVNVVGTTEMLDAFARANVRPNRIILASSRAVYGEGMWRDTSTGIDFYPNPRTHEMLAHGQWVPNGPSGAAATPLPHNASVVAPRPTSVYGATKLAQEHILTSWCGAFGVPLSVLRLQNVYGEGQSPYNSYTGIINVFHRLAREGKAIPVYEDGLIGRDFVHVDDVVEVIARIFADNSVVDHKFDVGTGTETTILEAAQVIAELHGAAKPVICGKFRDGDVRAAVADVSAMRAITGVSPKVSFVEGSTRVGDWLIRGGHI
ncbi:NAD-dependent epimerase/dehydratase family protein [Agrobacterium tumefaciens]|uniref:NAD-dependent epimerase/dehydratase family protein n=1 Tax=Agrobacterium tumefaciens TaxID=358 RepID=UPI001573448C|nr:NAD-dependent epimerase/dehydratase family protein [Agrobacterium tumefaciens]NSZ02207.1 NAD-dependent epimerase/dehydratase family protein [Agrobacterium tumefaciens]NSZ37090.1 NAD-dependent epimerase/dehydratase family protein [Agrobacterium tumefaciens]NTB26633.1 NAD-dependent epimerase/dehydratase family protein [Agrobacterium tumefaciens]NTB30374.1 NAD-dependent epimerase/dehydratase family protein [Agrobacterium tumefaciens]NTB32500.1 NAD-dependent epimerase/dehydratase family protein